MTKSTKRIRRTAAQLLEAKEAEALILRNRVAIETASNTPALKPLVEALEADQEALKLADRGLSKSPQSFMNRIHRHQVWINEIVAAEALALASKGAYAVRIALLTTELASMSALAAAGEKINPVAWLKKNAPVSVDKGLAKAYNDAHEARMTATNKATKAEASE